MRTGRMYACNTQPPRLYTRTQALTRRVFVCCTRPHRGAVGDKGRAFKGRSETENNFMKRSLINHSDIQGQAPFFPVSSSSQGQTANSLSVMQEHGHIFLSNPIRASFPCSARAEDTLRFSVCTRALVCLAAAVIEVVTQRLLQCCCLHVHRWLNSGSSAGEAQRCRLLNTHKGTNTHQNPACTN